MSGVATWSGHEVFAHTVWKSSTNMNLSHVNLTNCSVYGISVWITQTEGAIQDDLVITPRDEPIFTVDNLDVAQFIYLLLTTLIQTWNVIFTTLFNLTRIALSEDKLYGRSATS
jgi:hypothetical protein